MNTTTRERGSIENSQRYYILEGAKQGIIATLSASASASASALCVVALNLVKGLLS